MLTAAIIGVLGLIPGMPNLVFLLLAATLGGMAWMQRKRIAEEAAAPPRPRAAARGADARRRQSGGELERRLAGGRARLEVGYRLIPMVDKGRTASCSRHPRLRKKFAQEVGFLSAPSTSATTSSSSPMVTSSLLAASRSAVAMHLSWPVPSPSTRGVSARLPDARPPTRLPGLPWFGVDRRLDARAGARARLHRGGREHRGGDPPQPRHPQPRRRAAWAARDPGPASTTRQGIARWSRTSCPSCCRSAPCSACCRTCSRKASTSATCAASSRCSPENAPRVQDPAQLTTRVREGARPRHPAGPVPGQCRGPGDGAPSPAGAHPRCRPWLRAARAGAIELGLADTLLRQTAQIAQRQEDVGLPPVLLVPAQLRPLLSRFLRRAVPSSRGEGRTIQQRWCRRTRTIPRHRDGRFAWAERRDRDSRQSPRESPSAGATQVAIRRFVRVGADSVRPRSRLASRLRTMLALPDGCGATIAAAGARSRLPNSTLPETRFIPIPGA